jgi:hypothetical protein
VNRVRIQVVGIAALIVAALLGAGLAVVSLSAAEAGAGRGRSRPVGVRDPTRIDPPAPGGSTSPLRVAPGRDALASTGASGTGSSIPVAPAAPIVLHTPGGTLSLTPLGVSQGADAGQVARGGRSVVFRSPARDTATTVTPQPAGGVEISDTLRSSSAPSSFSWVVKLDGVERLVPTTDGGVNVVKVAASTSPPPHLTPPPGGAGTGHELAAAEPNGGRPRGPLLPPNSYAETRLGPTGNGSVPPPCDLVASVTESSGASGLSLAGSFSSLGPVFVSGCSPRAALPVEASSAAVTSRALRPSLSASHVRTGKGGLAGGGRLSKEVVVASIAPPRSTDARGVQVPTSLSVSGDVVTMHVDRGAGRYTYPLTADPLVKGQSEPAPCSEIVQSGFDATGHPVLTLHCKEWFAVGFNDYRLMNYADPAFKQSEGGPQQGCGAIMDSEDQEYEIKQIAATGVNVIRVWFFQKYYQDYLENEPKGKGWEPYIHLLKAAKAAGLLVIPVIANEWDQCDRENGTLNDGNHLPYTFYEPGSGGYEAPQFSYHYSTKQWAQMVAEEFSPNNSSGETSELWKTIAFYQVINEAELDLKATSSECAPNGAQLLYNFGENMAHTLKTAYVGSGSVTPPLVSLGTMGIGQCGVSSDVPDPVNHPSIGDYAYANSAPEINICEVHDYDAEGVSDTTHDWYGLPNNSLQQRISDCSSKPLFVGEAGLEANVQPGAVERCDHPSPPPGCPKSAPEASQTTLEQRAQDLSDKMEAAFNAGASGYIVWDKIMASSASKWNIENDETLGYGAYGYLNEGQKHQDPSLCVINSFAEVWLIGEAPETVPSAEACDKQVAVPGSVDHFAFVDGTAEGWGGEWKTTPGTWGDLGTTYSSSFNHGELYSESGSLKITVGGGPLDTREGLFIAKIEGTEFNPHSEMEVNADSVALLTPGATVSMWLNNQAKGLCASDIEVTPMLRVNKGWDEAEGSLEKLPSGKWKKLTIEVPPEDPKTHEPVTVVNAVGLEVRAPEKEIKCTGESVYLDDVSW